MQPVVFNIVIDHLIAKVQDKSIWNILYADYMNSINENLACMERKPNTWNELLTNNGKRINVKATEYLHLPFGEEEAIIIIREVPVLMGSQ